MAKVSKDEYVKWLNWVYYEIDELNAKLTNAELTGKRVYRFGFYRKKKKVRIALWRDEELLAIGMNAIEKALIEHHNYYVLMKGAKEWLK